jgi:TctA family transporter
MSGGSLAIFFTRPIAAPLMIFSLLSIVAPLSIAAWRKVREAGEDQ